MATQYRDPVILLTRPQGQSARFAAALLARFPDLAILTSPLLAPRFTDPVLPARPWAALIFTSETAVAAARRIAADGPALPTRAFCVGDQTARTARAAGFDPISADGDAAALFDLITAQPSPGPMLHLHGRDTRGDLAEHLQTAGIETFSAIAYEQNLHPLSPQATELLHSQTPVIAPVFSPRSAQALAAECARIRATAPLSVIAISPAAAASFPAHQVTTATHPDAAAMIAAIASRLKPTAKP